MKLTSAQKRTLKDAFKKAAESCPNPDSPVMHPGDLKISPRQLAHEIENETPVGKYFISVIEDAVTYGGIPFNSVIEQFGQRKSAQTPRAQ